MENNNKNVSEKLRRSVWEWLETIVISCLLVVFIFTFVFRIVGIDGDSMLNTLVDKERVIISDLFYTPSRGDIVVISRNYYNDIENKDNNSSPIIKRVIATEGETVDIRDGHVFVNGEMLNEPYARTLTNPYASSDGVTFPVTVPENCVFVLGDNRGESWDSRSLSIGEDGMIDERYILGKALFRIFPFQKFGGIYE